LQFALLNQVIHWKYDETRKSQSLVVYAIEDSPWIRNQKFRGLSEESAISEKHISMDVNWQLTFDE